MKERQPKAVCPHCGHWDSTVIQSWPDPAIGYIRRRRCTNCKKRYRTKETLLRADAIHPRIGGSQSS